MEGSETLNLVPTLIPFVLVIFVIAIGVVLLSLQFQKNLFKKQLEKEALNNKHQQTLLETSVHIQEEERNRISQDLHDQIGAALSICRMQLVQLESKRLIDPQKVKETRKLIENTLAETRRISHELMPLNLKELGFKKALMSLLSQAEETGQFKTVLSAEIDNQNVPWQVQLGLYRIYAELINNTLKHGNATLVQVTLLEENDSICGSYSDDGIGIKDKQIEIGLGLKSIENRVDYLQGEWEYGNQIPSGFSAKFKLPLVSN